MTSTAKDITEIVLQSSELPRDIAAVRKKCMKLPMVADCDARLSAFKGRQIEDGRYEVDITGTVAIRTKMKLAVSLDATGTGIIDSSGRELTITDVRILNDFHGVFGRVLQMSGLATGRTLKLREKDSAVIRSALSA